MVLGQPGGNPPVSGFSHHRPVTDVQIGRALRALRHRRGLRQVDVARLSGVTRTVISELEAGRAGIHRLDRLRAVLAALGASVRVEVEWHGAGLARLLDADHATLQATWKARLEQLGWLVRAEVTFSRYGERGSIDLLAFHPATRVLLVVEIKTGLFDVQDLLSVLDRKVRLAPAVAREIGWRPLAVVPLLVLPGDTSTRRRLTAVAPLFAPFVLRGRVATAWLREPGRAGRPAPTGLLVMSKVPDARNTDLRRAGRQRIRRPGPVARSLAVPSAPPPGSDRA